MFMLSSAVMLLLGLAACSGTEAGTQGGSPNMAATPSTNASGATTPGPAANGPRLSFKEGTHDFGKISSAEPIEYKFTFINTGNQPLQIIEVKPEPPREGA